MQQGRGFREALYCTGGVISEFSSAVEAAQNALLDQNVLSVSEKSYAAFVSLLDAPPQVNERLRKTLQTKPVWE